MGCCISKCSRPEKHSLEQHQFNHNNNNVQDKLVISQATTNNSFNKITPSPTSSSSSVSSFTCTRSSDTISSSSSSTLSSKDRSFSNEFLWSCYKDNPHITLRDTSLSFKPTKAQCTKTGPLVTKPNLGPIKQSPRNSAIGSFSMPHKRVRSNSPTNLTRHKSFRRELPEKGRSTIGSPSPSRRFNGDECGNSIMENKRVIINNSPKVNMVNYSSSVSRKEGFTAKGSGSNNSSRQLRDYYSGLRHRETCTVRIGSKIDETVVKDDVMMSENDMDSIMEDINNPLISLDCFIFL